MPSDHTGSVDKEQPKAGLLHTQAAAVASWLVVAVVLACAEVEALVAEASYLVH